MCFGAILSLQRSLYICAVWEVCVSISVCTNVRLCAVIHWKYTVKELLLLFVSVFQGTQMWFAPLNAAKLIRAY